LKIIGITLLSSAVALSLSADPLKTHTELSYMNSSGNSETDTLSIKSEFNKIIDEQSKFSGKLTGLYVTDSGEEIANRYYIEGQYNRKISLNFFTYLKANYSNDKFSGYNYRSNIGPGLGYSFPISNADHSLDFSLGALYSTDDIEEGDVENHASGDIALKYAWKILENLKFKQDLSYQTKLDDSENYFADSVTAFEYKLSNMISLGTSYTIHYQNNSPAKTNRDNVFLTSLIVDY
jgi:putative salt-induced outer membrane protein